MSGRPPIRHAIPDVEVVQAVRVTFQRGDGVETIFRNVTAWYMLDGRLLVEQDPLAGDDLVEDMRTTQGDPQ